MTIPVYKISVSEYNVKKKSDWEKIGSKIDVIIKKHFMGKKIAIRCLSSDEHDKSTDDLIKIIKKLGVDKYDPSRKGDRYENVDNKHIDIFALDFLVNSKDIMKIFIESFYVYPKKPIRIDIAIIYDAAKLKRVLHRYEGRIDIKRDGFVFKDPENKKDALLGIIKIL